MKLIKVLEDPKQRRVLYELLTRLEKKEKNGKEKPKEGVKK